jgi:D-glycero-alpha-D-manno-heptose 1-phosphate guanylyltransferase
METMKQINQVVVLAGGKGTRLKSISGNLPKPLVPIYDELTILDFIFKNIESWGINNVILSLCYEPESFETWLGSRNFPFEVETIVEDTPLGTGGALLYVTKRLDLTEAFGVINGDTYVDLDFKQMSQQYLQSDMIAMIGLSKVEDSGRYGKVEDSSGRVIAFTEKNKDSGEGWINNGCYLLSPESFKGMNGSFSLEREIFPKLCSQGILGAFRCKGAFRDIGIPEDFEKFSTMDAQSIMSHTESGKGTFET